MNAFRLSSSMRFDESRQELEAEIAHCTRVILEAKRRLNTLTYISQLPTEVLSDIFLYIALSDSSPRSDHPASGRRYQKSLGRYQWISIAQVCRHWRTVSLGTSSLWGTIWLVSPAWVKELLRRSRSAPLRIRAEADFLPADALEIVLPHLGRIASFEISSSWLPQPFDSSRILATNFGAIARRLEHISLTSQMSQYLLLDSQYKMESMFKGCDLPGLRRVQLAWYDKSWTNVLFKPTLTHLKLSSPVPYSSAFFRCTLEALAELPLLEHLDLEQVLTEDEESDEEILQSLNAVSLPNLRKLRLKDNASACSWLLCYMSFPVTASVALDCTFWPDPDVMWDNIEYLTRELQRNLGARPAFVQGSSCHVKVVHIDAAYTVHLQIWRRHFTAMELSDALRSDLFDPVLDICLRFPEATDIIPDCLLGILCFAQESTSCHLSIGPNVDLESEPVRSLGLLTGIVQLGITSSSIDWMCGLLVKQVDRGLPRDESNGPRSDTTSPFPCLSTLLLHDVEVRNAETGQPSSASVEQAATFPQNLIETLCNLKRADAQLKLQELVLRDCKNLCQADVDALSSVVDHVRVIGRLE